MKHDVPHGDHAPDGKGTHFSQGIKIREQFIGHGDQWTIIILGARAHYGDGGGHLLALVRWPRVVPTDSVASMFLLDHRCSAGLGIDGARRCRDLSSP